MRMQVKYFSIKTGIEITLLLSLCFFVTSLHAAEYTELKFNIDRHGDLNQESALKWEVQGVGDNPVDKYDFPRAWIPNGILYYGPGEKTKTITIKVNKDTFFEFDESFIIKLSTPKGNINLISQDVWEIRNDDMPDSQIPIELSLDWADGSSGIFQEDNSRMIQDKGIVLGGYSGGNYKLVTKESGPQTLIVKVKNAYPGEIVVNYSIRGSGSNPASLGDIYFPGSNFIGNIPGTGSIILKGKLTEQIEIRAAPDTLSENDEEFQVVISSPTPGVILNKATVDGKIIDNDYIPIENFSVSPLSSSLAEGALGEETSFNFKISHNNKNVITNYQYDAQIDHLSLDWKVIPGDTSEDDYFGNFPAGTVDFKNKETEKIVTIKVLGDDLKENDETFSLELFGRKKPETSGVIATGKKTASSVILNDDTQSEISSSIKFEKLSIEQQEGNDGVFQFFEFPLLLDTPAQRELTVDYEVVSYEDKNNRIYPTDLKDFGNVLPSGKVQIFKGSKTAKISIPVSGDNELESDEGFKVILKNPGNNLKIATNEAVGIIQADDPPKIGIELSFCPSSREGGARKQNEDSARFCYRAYLLNPYYVPDGLQQFKIPFRWEIIQGRAFSIDPNEADNPVDGNDFVSMSGQETLTIPDSKTVELTARADSIFEPDENFTVVFYDYAGQIIEHFNGVLVNDDINTGTGIVSTNTNTLSVAKRDIKLFRVVPISGTNPFEFNNLKNSITNAKTPTTTTTTTTTTPTPATTPTFPIALNILTPLPLTDNSGGVAQAFLFEIDTNNNLTVSVVAVTVGGNKVMSLFGNLDGISTGTASIFDSSGNPGTLISPVNGTKLAENIFHNIILQRNDGTIYKLTLRFEQSLFGQGDGRLTNITGFNCGTSQANCP